MATTKYNTYLSVKSVNHTIDQLKAYRDKFEKNIERFCEEAAKVAETEIKAILAEHYYTGQTLGSVKIITEGSGKAGWYKAAVQVSSDAILFLEFGSGLHYGAPHAGDMDPPMGPGTFEQAKRQNPEFPNWANPEGWVYIGDDGNLHWSKGMAPSMPMYRGAKEMEWQLARIAKKVFG